MRTKVCTANAYSSLIAHEHFCLCDPRRMIAAFACIPYFVNTKVQYATTPPISTCAPALEKGQTCDLKAGSPRYLVFRTPPRPGYPCILTQVSTPLLSSHGEPRCTCKTGVNLFRTNCIIIEQSDRTAQWGRLRCSQGA